MILKYPSLIVIALIVQCLCAAFFLADIVNTAFRLTRVPISWQVHEAIEIGASIGLILGAVMVGLMLRASLARTAHVESELRVASGAFQELLEDRFTQWALTPAERDVALFAIKGPQQRRSPRCGRRPRAPSKRKPTPSTARPGSAGAANWSAFSSRSSWRTRWSSG